MKTRTTTGVCARRCSRAILALTIALAGAGPLRSASINWGTPTTITNNAADVFTLGTTVYAYDESNTTTNVNGVVFVAGNSPTTLGGGNITMTGFTGGVNNTTFGNPTGMTGNYTNLTKGAAWATAGTSVTVNLNNLASGRAYAAQVWVNDSRTSGANRTETVTSAGGNTVTLDYNSTEAVGGAGQYTIGGFTADAATQAFTLLGNGSTQMNAIQLRDVTGLWSGAAGGAWADATASFTGGNSWSTVTGLLGGTGTVTFADTDGFKNAVTNSAIAIQAAGVSTGTVVFQNTTVGYTFTNASGTTGITGTTAISKTGTGTVTFAGANTYTGTTTIAAGTLQFAKQAALYGNNTASWTDANLVVNSGALAAFNVGGAEEFTVSDLDVIKSLGSATGGFRSGAVLAMDTTNAGGNFTYSGNIANPNGGANVLNITKLGAGSLILGGANSYTGTTVISAGTLVAANPAALGATGAIVTVGNGATLDLATDTSINAYTLNINSNSTGTVLVDRATPGAAITHTMGNFTIGNGGLIALAGPNVTSGTPVLAFPNLILAAGVGGATATLNATGTDISITGNVTRTGGSANALTLDGTTTGSSISGILSGPQTLTKNGAGTWTLSNANTFTGNTKVNAGSLKLTNPLALQASAFDPSGAGTLDLTSVNTPTFGGLTGSGAYVLPGNVTNLTLNPGTGITVAYSGNLSSAGTATLTKSGLGTQKLDFSAAGAPATNIVSSGIALAMAGGTLNITGGNATSNSQTFNGTTLARGVSTISLTTNATPQNLVLNLGALSSTGGTVSFVLPAGTQSATNGITTTTADTNGMLGGWATVNGTDWAHNDGTNVVPVTSYTLTSVAGNSSGNYAALNIAVDSSPTLDGAIAPNSLNFNAAGTNTVTLTGLNTVSSGGILVTGAVGANQSNITGGSLQGPAGGNLYVAQNNTGTNTALTIGSVLQDNTTASGLIKAGSGVLVLASANTYTGNTTISAGAIVATANDALGTAAGSTTVASGAALGLSGNVTYSTKESLTGSGTGPIAAVGSLAAVQRGFVQSVSGNNTFAGDIQLGEAGESRIGTQSGAQLTLGGNITMGAGITGARVLFRTGDAAGDFVTLANNGNSWDLDTTIFTANTTAGAAGAGVRLGIANALPTGVSITGSSASTGAGTSLDMAGYNQALNGLISGSQLKIYNSAGNGTTSTLTLNPTADKVTTTTTILDGAAGGTVALVKTGSFNQTLSTANTFTGGTTVKNGSLILSGGNNRLAANGAVILGDAGTTGKLVLGTSAAAVNQTLSGLTATGLGGSVVGAAATGNSVLTLDVASGTSTFGGTLGGTGTNENRLALAKSGAGTFALTANNSFTGPTTAAGGTLALTGTDGAVSGTSGVTVTTGGTLKIDNSAAANNPNRVNDAATISMAGGTLNFSNDAGAADFSETLGALAVSGGVNAVLAGQAAVAQASTLTFASLSYTAGSIDFSGPGLGVDNRNRILFTANPTLVDGKIGAWATYNGMGYASYDPVLGITEFANYTDIDARGSTITDNSTSNVRINAPGTVGDIELSAATTTVTTLFQNTTTAATVNTANKTFSTSGILIGTGKESLTIGANIGDGLLTPATASGTINLSNASSSALTVNAVIADNGGPSGVSTSGNVTLNAVNTYTGNTTIGTGSLILATNLDLSPAGTFSGPGTLVKSGAGNLTLSGNNTHSGGTTVNSGLVVASRAASLGTGPVVNNGTLNLAETGAAVTYTGLSKSLSGNGVINVALSTGTNSTLLNGNYTAFSGSWNIGVGAGTGAGKVQMNGADNAAATINILTNATLYSVGAITHNATIVLNGGDTGEALGQLRLETNAAWAGPVTLAGNITGTGDGFVGGNSGQTGIISGPIGETGGSRTFSKIGGSAIILSGTNTYTGGTTVLGGTLQVGNGGTTGNLGSGPITNNAALSFNRSDTFAQGVDFTGLISGTGSLTQAGTGTLVLNGNNTYSGTTRVAAGTLKIASTLAIQNSAFDPSGAGVLDLSSVTTPTFGGLTGAGNLALPANVTALSLNPGAGATITYSGILGGNASVTKVGPGTQVFTGNNTYAGNTQVNEGTLSVSKALALPGYATPGRVAAGANGTLSLNYGGAADWTTSEIDALIANNGAGFVSGSRLGINTVNGNATYGTAITATNLGISKLGANALTLTGNNTYAGGTTLAAGTLRAGVDSAGTPGAITSSAIGTGTLIFNGGGISSDGTAARTILNALAFAGNATLGDATANGTLTFAGSADLGTAVRTLTVNSPATFSGAIGNSGGITMNGPSSLTLSGQNTYPGNTTLVAGTLLAGADSTGTVGAIASGPLGTGTLVLNGGTFSSDSATARTFLNQVVFGGNPTFGTAAGNGTLTFSAPASLGAAARTLTVAPGTTAQFDGAITETAVAGITKAGTGTLVLTNAANSFTGNVALAANSGTLRITSSGALGTGVKTFTNTQASGLVPVTGANLLELDSNGGADIVLGSNISFTTSGAAGVILNTAGNNAINGAFSLTFGNGATKIISNGGSLTLGGNISISPSAGGARTFELAGSSTGANAVGGAISNGSYVLSVSKTGGGTWALNAANSYTGATTITAGTLLINGSTAPESATTVAGGAMLGGSGTVGGNVTVASLGRLMAGVDSLDTTTLTLSGGLSMLANSIIELGLASGATTHDILARTGSGDWTFQANQTFNFLDQGFVEGMTYTGIITGLAVDPGVTGWTVANASITGTFAYNAGNIDFTLIAIPEPKTWVLIGLGLWFTLFRFSARSRRIKSLSGRA